jgi:hypothetical protein
VQLNAIVLTKSLAASALLMLTLQGSAIAGGCGDLTIVCRPHVPELDLHTVGAALTMFGGMGALLIERYRRRKR